jgi:transposase-like protein
MEAIVMNTREIASEYRMAQWAQILHERKESGESVKDFCHARGINRDSYFYWQRKLREAAYDQLESAQVDERQKSMVPFGFSEVKLQTVQQQRLEAYYGQQSALVAEVRGARLSVDCTYPVDKLAYLLRELVAIC